MPTAKAAPARRTPPKDAPAAGNRRSPAQLLAHLQAERERVATKLGNRIVKLDERIARLEKRYETQLQLAALTSGASIDDLQQQLEDASRQQKLIRLALKSRQT